MRTRSPPRPARRPDLDQRPIRRATETDGWLYLVTLTGTTGARDVLRRSPPRRSERTIAANVPLYAGFDLDTGAGPRRRPPRRFASSSARAPCRWPGGGRWRCAYVAELRKRSIGRLRERRGSAASDGGPAAVARPTPAAFGDPASSVLAENAEKPRSQYAGRSARSHFLPTARRLLRVDRRVAARARGPSARSSRSRSPISIPLLIRYAIDHSIAPVSEERKPRAVHRRDPGARSRAPHELHAPLRDRGSGSARRRMREYHRAYPLPARCSTTSTPPHVSRATNDLYPVRYSSAGMCRAQSLMMIVGVSVVPCSSTRS
jgi:hypothetical protein